LQVVDWILGPGEKLLASQSDIGDSAESAEVLRKRHEELEIKCTVRLNRLKTIDKYSTLLDKHILISPTFKLNYFILSYNVIKE